ncbi:MAG: hypothetical protein ACREUV_04755 [Burkholderiales bacterium]
MIKHKKLGMAVAGACALLGSTAASAFSLKAGDWDVSFSGDVNAFYTYSHCDNNARPVVGGIICTTSNQQSNSQVRGGLLPSALVFSAKTQQEGFDIGVTFGLYPGINSSAGGIIGANGSGSTIGLATSGIDFRQNFFTIGDKDIGTFKLGRDIGIFGSDAILSDITIIGVGTTLSPRAPTNTSLGRIGLGYIYTDFSPQITYISPNVSGFQGSVGIFQPFDQTGFGAVTLGGPGISASLTGHQTPGVQGKVTYDYNVAGVTGRTWVGGFYQRTFALAGDTVGVGGATAIAGEAGVKGSVAGFDAVLYGYYGRGIGTTAFLFDGVAAGGLANGNRRNSKGGYAQLGYRFGKWHPVVSYGASFLDLATSEAPNILVARNRSYGGGVYYSLTKSVTLDVEFFHNISNNHIGGSNVGNDFSVGGIIFF